MQVEFHTTMERGAGTDANVSFKLVGEKGESKEQRVTASREVFERGTVDKFSFKGCVVCNTLCVWRATLMPTYVDCVIT